MGLHLAIIRLAIIHLLARLSSDVIARYVAEVSLSSNSELYRQAVCSRDMQEIVSAARVSSAAARQELDGVAASFREAHSSVLQSASQAVRRMLSRTVHRKCSLSSNGRRLVAGSSASPQFQGPLSGRCRGCFRVRGGGGGRGCGRQFVVGVKATLVVTAAQPAFTPQSPKLCQLPFPSWSPCVFVGSLSHVILGVPWQSTGCFPLRGNCASRRETANHACQLSSSRCDVDVRNCHRPVDHTNIFCPNRCRPLLVVLC